MNFTTRIALRHLLTNHNFGLISFSTILSIIGLMLGISSLIIISCISDGFNDVINNKLSGIDGHIRIQSYLSDKINDENIHKLDSIINQQAYSQLTNAAPYIEKHAIIRNGSHSEGVIVYGVKGETLNSIFKLNEFTKTESRFYENNSIIVGNKLAELMDISKEDSIIMLNPEDIVSRQLVNASMFKVANTFQTDFPEYDKLLVFIPLEKAKSIFDMESEVTGLILNVNNPYEVENTDILIADALGFMPYMTTTWKERHASLLDWLNVYDIPIQLIIFFIAAVGVFNIAASLWMIVIDKTREFAILQSMGLTIYQMKQIIVKEGAMIGLTGSVLGVIMSFLILYLETVYQIIKLPNDVYFMEYLPVKISFVYFLIYPTITLLMTIVFSYIPANNYSKISPSEALRYE